MKFFTTTKLSENISVTPEGYLLCLNVPIARTGEMLYHRGELPLDGDDLGRITVVRNPNEVFRAETIASFEGKPVTLFHPDEFVDPKSWSSKARGGLHNVRRGEGANASDLMSDILITEASAIELVKNGLREVSCGYDAEYVEIGIGRYEQKNIIGNHLALVEEGRAGAAYAINDHKGKVNMSLKTKLTAAFRKAETDLLKEIGGEEEQVPAAKTVDAVDLKGVLASIEALSTKVDALAKPAPKAKTKDDLTAPNQAVPAEAVAEPVSMEERLLKLEQLVAKLVERETSEETVTVDEDKKEKEETDDEESDEVTDEAGEEGEETGDEESGEESEDSAEEEKKDKKPTSDSVSRIEILAPGKNFSGKDAKRKALETAFQTKDGKAVILQFTDGKAPNFKNEAVVNTLFVGASELLKVKRQSVLAQAKMHTIDYATTFGVKSGAKTAEEINEMNAKRYGVK